MGGAAVNEPLTNWIRPGPYGIKDNTAMLKTLIDYSYEQKLAPHKVKLEDIFAASTLDL